MGKFLNEENYQRTKKKLSLIALIVLICGIVVGGLLIIGGVVNKNQANKKDFFESTNQERVDNFKKESSGMFMIVSGAGIIMMSGIASLALFLFAKRREIAAFSTQQIMPVAQEGVDAITPTIANAAGTVAGEVVKAVNKAKKEDNQDK